MKQELPRTVSPKVFCQWPEWKALASRLGVPAKTTRIVLDVSLEDGVRLTVTTIGTDHSPCHTPPSDTRPMVSSQALSEAETTPTPAANVDTQHGGDVSPGGSSNQR